MEQRRRLVLKALQEQEEKEKVIETSLNFASDNLHVEDKGKNQ